VKPEEHEEHVAVESQVRHLEMEQLKRQLVPLVLGRYPAAQVLQVVAEAQTEQLDMLQLLTTTQASWLGSQTPCRQLQPAIVAIPLVLARELQRIQLSLKDRNKNPWAGSQIAQPLAVLSPTEGSEEQLVQVPFKNDPDFQLQTHW
jgi:hypothetical protein